MMQRDDKQIANEMYAEIRLPNEKTDAAFVLLVGGFQGSGKSTVLQRLSAQVDLALITTDRIRQLLLNEGYEPGEVFRQMVEEITKVVLLRLIGQGYSVAVDTNATPKRIARIAKYLDYSKCQHILKTVYLDATKDELIQRIQDRKPKDGEYTGTVGELEWSMERHGEIDTSSYDLVIETSNLTAGEVVDGIQEFIEMKA